uniref:Uncharacterized protein n=1 Tax=Glossina palpalis gambiensis TaxID=67801 RepID=A0A1B0AXE6_9MUSC
FVSTDLFVSSSHCPLPVVQSRNLTYTFRPVDNNTAALNQDSNGSNTVSGAKAFQTNTYEEKHQLREDLGHLQYKHPITFNSIPYYLLKRIIAGLKTIYKVKFNGTHTLIHSALVQWYVTM